jgi:hypothetical protein
MHVDAPTIIGLGGVCEKAQRPASAGLKPLPVIETVLPLFPELGLRTIVGAGAVTVKTAVAKSPLVPLTSTTYTPGVAALATVKLLGVN